MPSGEFCPDTRNSYGYCNGAVSIANNKSLMEIGYEKVYRR
jgi:hypothetical protein